MTSRSTLTAALLSAAFLLSPVSVWAEETPMLSLLLMEEKVQLSCLPEGSQVSLTLLSRADFSGAIVLQGLSGNRLTHRLRGAGTLNFRLTREQFPLDVVISDNLGSSMAVTLTDGCLTSL